MVNFLQLRYFVVIANYQNLSKASQELMVSQPALSKVISSLEEELGTPLFERQGKKLTLNSDGRKFLHTAEMILNLLDDSLTNLKHQHEITGEIHIALHISCTEFFNDLQAFSAVYPDVQVKLYGAEKLKGDPSLSNFNLAVLPDYEFQSLPHVVCGERTALYAILPAQHRLAKRPSIELIELKDEYFAFMSPRDGRLEQTYTLCIEAGFTPKVRYVAHDMGFFLHLATAGRAVALTYNTAVGLFGGRGDIAVVPVTGSYRLGRKIGLCLASDTPTPLEYTFFNFIKDLHESDP